MPSSTIERPQKPCSATPDERHIRGLNEIRAPARLSLAGPRYSLSGAPGPLNGRYQPAHWRLPVLFTAGIEHCAALPSLVLAHIRRPQGADVLRLLRRGRPRRPASNVFSCAAGLEFLSPTPVNLWGVQALPRTSGRIDSVAIDSVADLSVIGDAVSDVQAQFISTLCADRRSLGVMLYGSYARGTAGVDSDIDILHLVSDRPRSYAHGAINVTEYLPSHLTAMATSGSLFALHLSTEGRVVCDRYGKIAEFRNAMAPRRTYDDLKTELSLITPIIDPTLDDARQYVRGLVRIATYLLRTVAYINCIERGIQTFDLARVAQLLCDDELIHVIKTRKRRHVTMPDLALASRVLRRYLPSADIGRYRSVEQFAVSMADQPLVSALVLNVLAGNSDVPYTAIALPPR